MLILRIASCFIVAIALLAVYLGARAVEMDGFVVYGTILLFLPAFLAIGLIFLPVEIYCRGKGEMVRFFATLGAGALLPFLAGALLLVHDFWLPSLWSTDWLLPIGICIAWAFIWWLSGRAFPSTLREPPTEPIDANPVSCPS